MLRRDVFKWTGLAALAALFTPREAEAMAMPPAGPPEIPFAKGSQKFTERFVLADVFSEADISWLRPLLALTRLELVRTSEKMYGVRSPGLLEFDPAGDFARPDGGGNVFWGLTIDNASLGNQGARFWLRINVCNQRKSRYEWMFGGPRLPPAGNIFVKGSTGCLPYAEIIGCLPTAQSGVLFPEDLTDRLREIMEIEDRRFLRTVINLGREPQDRLAT